MQVDCYKRNYQTSVCSKKCKFYGECTREAVRELMQKEKEKKEHEDEKLIG